MLAHPVVHRGAGIRRRERALQRLGLHLLREADRLFDRLARLAGQADDERAVDQNADVVAVLREATRALDRDALLDVLENLLVARLVADDEEAEPAVLHRLQRLAVDVRARVRRPRDTELAEALRDRDGALRVGRERVVVEEELLHVGEVPLEALALLEHVLDAARAVAVAGRHLRPQAERAARRAAAARVERHVRVLAVGAVVLLVVEVARVDVGRERQGVQLLGGERLGLVVLLVDPVLEVTDAGDVTVLPALGDPDDRHVELFPRDVVDDAAVAEGLLGTRRHVAPDETDHRVGLRGLEGLGRPDVGPERGGARVQDYVVVILRNSHHVVDRQVLRRGVEQPGAGEHAGRVRKPRGVPEGPHLTLRLVASACAPVEVVVRGWVQEQRPHHFLLKDTRRSRRSDIC